MNRSWYRMMRLILGIVIGGGVGFLVGHFGKCAGGACPLTSNPLLSTLIGALVGTVISGGL